MFGEGLPFIHVKVDRCRLSDFLKLREPENLNCLLPRAPFRRESVEFDSPVLEMQVSVFACSGIALGWAASHKLIDGFTMISFLKAFSAVTRGGRERAEFLSSAPPCFGRAAELFPPREAFPENYRNLMETLWFIKGNYVTRRFIFDSESISKLRAVASAAGGKTEQEQGKEKIKLSRVEAVSCLIWKSSMAAARLISGGKPRTSILVEAVNLRDVTDPPLVGGDTIGNVFWLATAWADKSNVVDLPELAENLSGAIELYRSEYVKLLQGEEGFEALFGFFEQLEGLFEAETPDILAFTSWNGFGVTGQDFGWGDPKWVAVMGRPSPGFRNLTVLVDSVDAGGMTELKNSKSIWKKDCRRRRNEEEEMKSFQ
ncbi:unnamed protein product [Linum trigynum]|uniref:Uncharacterized protein n=1 Tax=Linum trigynum TaxID=586398 RepID=A0AAV2ENE4_9ROSI